MNWFITGTDTGCGKTHVTCVLLRTLRAAGRRVAGLKPVCCGERDDAEALREAGGGVLGLDEVNPVWRRTPAAPRAAELLGEEPVDPGFLLAAVRSRMVPPWEVLVEGAGGWLVPVTRDWTMADFAVALALPVLVVVPNRLGAINHTLLTLESIGSRGLPIAGLALNELEGTDGPARATNRRVLEESAGVPVLFTVSRGQQVLDRVPG